VFPGCLADTLRVVIERQVESVAAATEEASRKKIDISLEIPDRDGSI
jgi:hypothetical protein